MTATIILNDYRRAENFYKPVIPVVYELCSLCVMTRVIIFAVPHHFLFFSEISPMDGTIIDATIITFLCNHQCGEIRITHPS
jgi:hypothetical protein